MDATPTPQGDESREAARALLGLDGLADVADTLASFDDFRDAARQYLHLVMGSLGTPKGAVYLYDAASRELRPAATRGFPATALHVADPVRLARLRQAVAPEEAGIDLPPAAPGSSELVAPLAIRGTLLGLVRLGPRLTGEPFAEGDRDLLKVLVLSTSVALMTQRLAAESRESSLRLRRKVLEMETLRDVGMEISALRDLESLGGEILERAVGLIAPRTGLLLLYDESKKCYAPVAGLGSQENQAAVPCAAIHERLASSSTLLENDPARARELGATRSLLAAAIRIHDRPLGALVLVDKEGRAGVMPFEPDDASLLAGLAAQAAIAIENSRLYERALEQERFQKELQLAATIQQNLLPQEMPRLHGYDIAALTRPCRTIGGDYFDFIPLPDGRLLVVVADVAGKSIPAALLVFSLNATLYALLGEIVAGRPLPQIVAEMNRAIHRSSTSTRFITAVVAILDPKTGRLTSVNAGHNPPFHLRPATRGRDGEDPGGRPWEVRELRRGGLCLGMFDVARYEEEHLDIDPGDMLVLYSDGVTEARDVDDGEFGTERLVHALHLAGAAPAEGLVRSVLSAVDAYAAGAPQSDDITVMVIRRLPA